MQNINTFKAKMLVRLYIFQPTYLANQSRISVPIKSKNGNNQMTFYINKTMFAKLVVHIRVLIICIQVTLFSFIIISEVQIAKIACSTMTDLVSKGAYRQQS